MYSQSITRAHRSAFVLLIDGSGSMAEEVRFQSESLSKAAAVARIANELIYELIERARRSEGLRNYYDIAILNYSGDHEVCSLFDGGKPKFMAITELAERPTATVRTVEAFRRPDGTTQLHAIDTPQWVQPHASGNTPMLKALRVARDLIAEWCADPANTHSFPPIIFNITDGEASDGSDEELREAARRIQTIGTADGTALLFNIHVASDERERTLFCPSKEEALHPNRYAQLLYDASSELPVCFNEAIRSIKGATAMPPFRGMSFNASALEVIALLNIGSISIKTE